MHALCLGHCYVHIVFLCIFDTGSFFLCQCYYFQIFLILFNIMGKTGILVPTIGRFSAKSCLRDLKP